MGEKQIQTIRWHTDALKIDFLINKDGVICVDRILPTTVEPSPRSSPNFESSELPLVSIRVSAEGSGDIKTAKTLVDTTLSDRLRYQSHRIIKSDDGSKETLTVDCSDNATNIHVVASFTIYGSIPVVRAQTTITNQSTNNQDIVLSNISTLMIGNMTSTSDRWFEDYSLFHANSTWFREGQWEERSLPSVGLDNNGVLELGDGLLASLAHFELSSRGSFSTGGHLPMGALKQRNNEDTWMWQVENNASWRWDLGDFKDSIYLAAFGPMLSSHGWKKRLSPGQSFTTVPVACCRVKGDEQATFAALTDYRRQIRRPHDDMERMPIIFNDYMNCLMGDTDENKAYPQPGWTDELNALSVVNSIMGRVYLSGRIDLLSDNQLAIVKEGLEVYKSMRGDLHYAHPTWPLGLPKWHDDWVALALTSADGKTTYLAVWRRDGPTEVNISLEDKLRTHKDSKVSVLYPNRFTTKAELDGAEYVLHLKLPAEPCARILKIESQNTMSYLITGYHPAPT
ncbi:uncharacterized protein BDZ83DRAFT_758709 [Colletotrichum acutatum]|uniref:Glycosyl hydrolase family 36 N-terminal domain-containing protein n=1 Tax=Glomerella acutata TaxID=27357 RepID=A0AAD8U7K0_GLOAC|nr:uncharacterized protein BDZ83DRAFT_758709 [Colletotrichum acutatum]KAK1704795.1 hypothetical protein BDZ83DRAFT_758709 [Colletotrichum acutatum]